MLLSLFGGALGLLLAVWGTKVLLALSPPELMDLRSATVNVPVLLFTIGLTLVTGIAFGLVPAFEASRFDINEPLKESGKGVIGGTRAHRVRSLFVVAQVALALVLLIGAGLLMKSLNRLQSVEPGFDPEQSADDAGELAHAQVRLGSASCSTFSNRRLKEIRAIPGVESAGAINTIPFGGPHSGTRIQIEGQPKRPARSGPLAPASV